MKLPELKTLPTQEEVDALRAQVELLRRTYEASKFTEMGDAILGKVFSTTPAQCLAEVRAQAIEALNTKELYLLIKTYGSKDCAYRVQEYLESKTSKLRQQDKG